MIGQMPEPRINTEALIYALSVESYNTSSVPFAFSELIFPEPEARERRGGPKPMGTRERVAHFLSLIGPPTERGCREWQGSRLPRGYGQFNAGRLHGKCNIVRAHRTIYELAYGLLPDDIHVRHSCDNPPCCELRHLLPGTPYDNVHDAVDRGRTPLERPGRWTIDRAVREQVLTECLTGPRGTTARLAREHGVSVQHMYTAAQRYLAAHGLPQKAVA